MLHDLKLSGYDRLLQLKANTQTCYEGDPVTWWLYFMGVNLK